MTPGKPAPSEGDVNSSPLRSQWRESLSAATRALLDEADRDRPRQPLPAPRLDAIERAEGATRIDVEGRRILDFHGNSVHQLGHGHPKVVAAIKAELDVFPFCPRRFTNRTSITLAQKLGSLAPGNLRKVLFAPSGAA